MIARTPIEPQDYLTAPPRFFRGALWMLAFMAAAAVLIVAGCWLF